MGPCLSGANCNTRQSTTRIQNTNIVLCFLIKVPLRRYHNERDGVSNHQPHDCLLKRLFRGRPKELSKLRATGLRAGNSQVTDEFPTQRASNAEKSFHLMTSSWFSRTRINMAWPEPCQLFSSSSPLVCPIPVSPWHARPPCMHAAGGLTSKDTPIWCPPRAKCQEYYPLPTCSKCSVPVNPRWLTALSVRTNP